MFVKSQINLLDTSFTLHSDESDEYIQSLIRLINTKIVSIQEDVDIDDPLKTAILTLLLITHELNSISNELNSTNAHALDSVKKLLFLLESKSDINLLSQNLDSTTKHVAMK